jgi:sugar phosphate permease
MPDKGGLFYGWTIVGCALLALLVTNGLTIGGLTVFDEVLIKEFGWSRGRLKFRDLLQFGVAGLLSPLAGGLADRFGVRPLMFFGSLLMSAGFALYSRIDSLAGMYGIHLLFAVCLASCGLAINVLVVSRWFVHRRGTAIGLTLVGTSLGGILMPPLNTWLVSSLGWRNAFLVLAGLPVLLFLVLLALVKESPADLGVPPLGAAPVSAGQAYAPEGMEFKDALKTWSFWVLAVSAMMTFYCILGVAAHLFLHLRGQGLEPAAAARGISLLFGMGLLGKFSFGWLGDVMDRKTVFILNLGVMLVGSLCLASMRASLFWPFLFFFGFGWGGLYTMLQLLTVDCFGLKAAGKILGMITVLDAIGGGLGPWITGVLFDRTRSYALPFAVVAGLVFLALLAGLTLRVPQSQPAAAPSPA